MMQSNEPLEFHQWWEAQLVSGVAPSAVIDGIQGDDDVSICRRMLVAYFGGLEVVNDLIESCLHGETLEVRMYAFALDAYRRTAQNAHRDGGPSAPSIIYRPRLESDLERLEMGKQTWFKTEVACAIHAALGAGYLFQGKPKEALRQASFTITLGETLRSKVCMERGRSILVSSLAAEGHIGEVLAVLEASSETHQTAATKPYNFRMEAYCLSQLGRLDDALRVLERASSMQIGTKDLIDRERTRIKLLWGIGGLDDEIIPGLSQSVFEQQLFSSLQALLRGYAIPKSSSQQAKRDGYFREAIAAWSQVTHGHEVGWGSFMQQWLLAKAHYLLGETGLALNGFEMFEQSSEEMLDIRLLQAGMALDLALHFNQPALEIHKRVDELRIIFRDARRIPLASGIGLANRLMYWHPVAAAFCALMPSPIRELDKATSVVLKMGHKCSQGPEDLPPSFAAEVALRALDVDRNPQIKFVQADLGRNRALRQGSNLVMDYVGTPAAGISAATIVFGLVKMGCLDEANTIYREYGVTPISHALYPMLQSLSLIDRYTRMLLNQEMDVNVFSRAVNDLGSGVEYAA